jgi:tripartite-type tricarboxylate transporter receptor subunit TctC
MTDFMPAGLIKRRQWLAGVGAVLATPALAQAPWRPDQPVRLLVGFAPGGAVDTVARLVAQGMGPALGQQVVVENRPGAGANIAAEAVAHSPPNGATLLMGAFAHGVNPSIMKLNYDPLKNLAAVSQISTVPTVMLASAKAPFATAAEAIAHARAHPEQVTYGSGGVGTSSHLAPELLATQTGCKLVHVPYRGGAPAMQGLLAGDVDLLFDNPQPATRAAVEDGKVRALAIMQPDRLPDYPTVPAITEARLGADLTVQSWHGIFTAGGTPAPVVQALNAAVLAALADPTVRRRIEGLSITVVGSTPDAFATFYAAETRRWAEVVQKAGIKAE